MEQTIVDFLSKSSELILSNRLPSPKPQDAPQGQTLKPKHTKFQLCFDQKFNFAAKIPSQWTSNSNKVLVLEFFLVNKSTSDKFLAEQWVFELNQVSGGKLKDTIDSQNTLYKKLSVLLRSISLLTVTLPLYKSCIGDKNSTLYQHYNIEYSINFTRHTLSSWHSSLHEEKKNLGVYSNPELVIPGRAFIFKVNYPKSLDFLEMMVGEQVGLETGNLRTLKEKLDIDYFNPKRRERAISDQNRNLHSIRKSTSDSTNKINTSGGNMSPKEHHIGSEGVSENLSPFGSLFGASPIETQMSPRQVAEMKRKNSGGSYPWENKNSAGNRPRFGTVDSASSGEYDMYIYEDGEFTEVVSVREINVRDESPRKFSVHPKGSEDEQTFGEAAKRTGSHDLRLSPNASSKIDKLIEKSDDDKIAEIIHVVDELKEHLHLTMTQEMSQKSSFKTGGSGSGNEKKIGGMMQKGFKFYMVQEDREMGQTLGSDYEEMVKLYNKLKK